MGGIVTMTSFVTIENKQHFVRWFLKNYQLKRREGVWILNFLLTNDNIMENVHFVENVQNCPRAMVMSTVDDDHVPFCFYKRAIMSTDAEKAFHDLRMNPHEPMYIQLNFSMLYPHMEYLAVLEDNPYSPEKIAQREQDELTITQLLDESLFTFQREQLLQAIDEALDQGDKARFLQLSQQLNQLQK